jgi:hypothetical protein
MLPVGELLLVGCGEKLIVGNGLLLTEAAGLSLGEGLDGVWLLADIGVPVSEHWNSSTVHATVALRSTVQLFVTKKHFVALGSESNTQLKRVIVTDKGPPTRKSTELPLNTLAEQVHETWT